MNEKTKIKGQLGLYLQWPLFLGILVILTNIAVAAFSAAAGLTMSIFTLLYFVTAVFLYAYKRKKLLADLIEFSADYAWVQKRLLSDLDLPYAMVDETGRLLWMNERFAELIKEEKGGNRTLLTLFPDITKEELSGIEESVSLHTSFRESKYRMDLKPVLMDSKEQASGILETGKQKNSLVAVYLFDETEVLKYRQEIDDQKMVAGLIYLDNYDEALESVEEVRRSLLMALINRKINKYISGMTGVVKELEKDKYFFAIKQHYIPELREQRFSILEEVKAVNIGNEMSVTLSIGLGMGGETYGQNYEFARFPYVSFPSKLFS